MVDSSDQAASRREQFIFAVFSILVTFSSLAINRLGEVNLRSIFFSGILCLSLGYICYFWNRFPPRLTENKTRGLLLILLYMIFMFWLCAIVPGHLLDLTPDKPSPQYTGELITWTAKVDEYDPFDVPYYLFKLSPSVNGFTEPDSTPDNNWTWNTTDLSAGRYSVEVRVRENAPVTEDNFDGRIRKQYLLKVKPIVLESNNASIELNNGSITRPPFIIIVPNITDLTYHVRIWESTFLQRKDSSSGQESYLSQFL